MGLLENVMVVPLTLMASPLAKPGEIASAIALGGAGLDKAVAAVIGAGGTAATGGGPGIAGRP